MRGPVSILVSGSSRLWKKCLVRALLQDGAALNLALAGYPSTIHLASDRFVASVGVSNGVPAGAIFDV